jgi:hypothetical protein
MGWVMQKNGGGEALASVELVILILSQSRAEQYESFNVHTLFVRTACVRRIERMEHQNYRASVVTTSGPGPFCFTVDGIQKSE